MATENSRPYQAALEEEWDDLRNFFKENPEALSSVLSAAGDNAFHLAVFSNSKQPLEDLLGNAKEGPMSMAKYAYREKNEYGNTALHEAAANGNLEAVKLLVDYDKELSSYDVNDISFLENTNEEGETPLFKAAAYGRTKVVRYLASKKLKQLNEKTEYKITETGERKEVEYTRLNNFYAFYYIKLIRS